MGNLRRAVLSAGAGLLVAAGCGGKSGPGSTKTIDNAGTDGLIRVDDQDPTRDCPDGVLDVLAKTPSWVEAMEYSPLHPRLDACLRGNLVGDSIIVYASARPGEGSQSEESWPAARVIASPDGKILLEGAQDGGDWILGPAELVGLVDLDGDGIHEVLETVWSDALEKEIVVRQLIVGELIAVGAATINVDDNDYTCQGTWSVGPVAASGGRPLIVDVTSTGEPAYHEYGSDPDGLACAGDGKHQYWLEDGGLADDYVSPDSEGETDGWEGDGEDVDDGGVP